MSKQLKQTLEDIQDKKHSIRVDADKDGKDQPLQTIYINKKALEKAGVKISKIKSVEVLITVHGG
jgi:hypothetical protein